MLVTILAVGSRGDLDPLLAFGSALAGDGHDVRLATYPRFQSRVAAAGLGFAPLAEGEVSKGLASREGRRWLHRGSRRMPAAAVLIRDARSVGRQRLTDALRASEGSDAIVTGDLGLLLGWQAAQRHGAALVRVRLSPPGRIAAGAGAGALRQAAWLAARPWLSSLRRDLPLGPLPLREPVGGLDPERTLELCAYSSALVEAPAGGSGPPAYLTGYWFLEAPLDAEPPDELRAFLEAGDRPVCVGFGSMLTSDPAALSELIVQALDGRRGVLVGDMFVEAGVELPPNVLAVRAVAHSWLFERCAAAVHHGGAGTTAAALLAGVPSVTVPHMLDQRTWARRLRDAGASPAPVPRRRLTAPRLHRAISAAVGEPSFARRTAALRDQIAAEDGIAAALEAFGRHLGRAEREVSTTTHG